MINRVPLCVPPSRAGDGGWLAAEVGGARADVVKVVSPFRKVSIRNGV